MNARLRAVAVNELSILRSDPASLVVLLAMPLALMWFVRPAFGLLLRTEGFTRADGSAQSVPGFATMFSLFIAVIVATSFIREHAWGTWNRLRASTGSPWIIVLGKSLPMFFVASAQMGLLFLLGSALFDLRSEGPVIGLVAIVLGTAFTVVTMGVLLASVVRTSEQLTVLGNLGTLAFAAVGGAITPVATLPSVLRRIAPASPCYWTMRGFRAVILPGGDLVTVAESCCVLVAFGLAFALLASRRLRFDERKTTWD